MAPTIIDQRYPEIVNAIATHIDESNDDLIKAIHLADISHHHSGNDCQVCRTIDNPSSDPERDERVDDAANLACMLADRLIEYRFRETITQDEDDDLHDMIHELRVCVQNIHIPYNSDTEDEVPEVPASVKFVTEERILEADDELLTQEEQQCTICLCDFEEGDVVAKLPNCKHHLHAMCSHQWLTLRSSCPVCRASCLP